VLDQTVESSWKLLSKDKFPKLKDSALSMHWMCGKHTRVRVQFLRRSKSNLKTEIEWRSKHWTIVAVLLVLVGLL